MNNNNQINLFNEKISLNETFTKGFNDDSSLQQHINKFMNEHKNEIWKSEKCMIMILAPCPDAANKLLKKFNQRHVISKIKILEVDENGEFK